MGSRKSLDDVLNDRAARARRRFEVPVMAAALAVIPTLVVEATATRTWLVQAAALANWLIWGSFVAEFVVVTALADRRMAYARKAWLDLLVIFASFPLLGELLAYTRLLRLTRLVRVLRILRLAGFAVALARGLANFRKLLQKRGLGYVALALVILSVVMGGILTIFEGASLADGLWWSVVTLTTVGYGDIIPQTTGGRLSAAILMVGGIGVVSFITAAIASYLVDQEQDDDMQRIHERLDRIEVLLSDLDNRVGGQPSTPDHPGGREDSSP